MRPVALVLLALTLAATKSFPHHPISAKFDSSQPLTLAGIVTAVDWRNPHAHVFVNVTGADQKVLNWAVELESPVTLEQSGWGAKSLLPGDAVTVKGIAARDGTRQIWGESLMLSATGRQVLYAVDTLPIAPEAPRPAPRWPDGTLRLGADAHGGYWSHPTATALAEKGANIAIGADGLL
ncbi:MAG TPA: DUF6152 family protein, partial [Gammaproteobacteria bacterium]|nr:DUF6152 family protein [Gammaproteobacteria bacterium]